MRFGGSRAAGVMDVGRYFNSGNQSISVIRDLGAGSLQTRPFPHLWSSPCLIPAHYEALLATLPPRQSHVADVHLSVNRGIRVPSSRILEAQTFPDDWRQFVAHHTSQVFWKMLARVFGAEIRSLYPDLERELDRPLEDWRVVRPSDEIGAEVTLECEIVVPPFEDMCSTPRDVPRTATATRLWTGLLSLGADCDEGILNVVVHPDAAESSDGLDATRSDGFCQLRLPHQANTFVGFVQAPGTSRRVSQPPRHGRSPSFVEFSVQVNHPAYGLLSRGPAQLEWFRLFQRRGYR